MITNKEAGTQIDEIAAQIFRISTPINVDGFGFSFNQYLLVDEEPLLFHTGPRGMFALTREAIATVIPLESLRWIGISHFENDECGALNAFLAVAPRASPVCGQVQGLINADAFDRAPHVLVDGATLSTGERTFRWFDTPHVPHGWDCGYLFEENSRALLCGDLLTQPGSKNEPLGKADTILGSSENLRRTLDDYAHGPQTGFHLERLAETDPLLLTCMHGSAFSGDGAVLLRALREQLETRPHLGHDGDGGYPPEVLNTNG